MRILLGLALLVTLALIGSSRRFWSLRRSPLGAVLTTGGWLALAVGWLLGPHGPVPGGLITAGQIDVLRPLVLFCLGWVGLMIGMQAHRQFTGLLLSPIGRLTVLDVVVSMGAFTFAGFIVLTFGPGESAPAAAVVLAGLMGVSGIGWSAEVRSLTRQAASTDPAAMALRGAAGLGSIAAVLIYGLLFKLIQHDALPGEAVMTYPALSIGAALLGLAVSAMIALTMGLMGLWLMKAAGRSESEFLVVLLGLVAFVAGGAAVLGYSPLFVSMLCGAVVVNMPGGVLEKFQRVIVEAEQPVAMALMLVAGTLIDPLIGVTAWLLILALLVVRILTKRLVAGRIIREHLDRQTDTLLPLGPLRQSPLAVALVMGYVLSPHASLTARLLDSGQLLMVVVMVGLTSDAAPLIQHMLHHRADRRRDQTTRQEPTR